VIILSITGGDERTESEWKNLLRSARFKVTGFRKKKGELDLIEPKPRLNRAGLHASLKTKPSRPLETSARKWGLPPVAPQTNPGVGR
jgi:hypothetical protein